jgi:hypothetical protein
MPTDANLQLQAQTTSTSTAHSSGKTLPKATMLNPLYVRFLYSAAQQASGSGVWTFGLSVSYDNGNSWHPDFIADDKAITLTSSAQSGEFSIPFQITRADLVRPDVIADSTHAVQIRADAVLSGSPTTPTITWQADMMPSRL